ncbi:transcription antitermination factor NusA-like protein [Bacillus ectoiniformans]|uniref:YueH family protein n=1 Tax=Bacillus ectoiniformans TaxID=1494429 RepID=UPI00195DB4F9|nr:transcription antitermination factor NusA-like protein [Bacillus ectoiniformans]
MKIRKTVLQDQEIKVYIYENKKEESFMVAVPAQEWSAAFSYEEMDAELVNKLNGSFLNRGLDEESASQIAWRINQWVREM